MSAPHEPGLEKGRVVEHFRVEAEIGRGGMGVVYRATDTKLDRTVALKMLPDELVGDAETRRRFVREAMMAASVTHANVAIVYEVGESDDHVYIALEHIEGATLRDIIDDSRLDSETALRLAHAIATGLATAHAAGVLHRDLKPANVMINQRDVVKLLDFGLAKRVDSETISQLGLNDADVRRHTSALVGTPAYMSPEQFRGAKLDERSDVFSLGILLYELVAGRRPFAGDTKAQLARAIIHDRAPALTELAPHAPRELVDIVDRCLRKQPSERFADAGEVVRALALLIDHRATARARTSAAHDIIERRADTERTPPPRRAWRMWLAGGLAIVAAALAWWLAS